MGLQSRTATFQLGLSSIERLLNKPCKFLRADVKTKTKLWT